MSDVDAIARAKFHELCAERDAILSVTAPKREARDKQVAKARAAEEKLNAELREIEAPLFDINREIGKLSRLLKDENGVSRTAEPA